MNKIKFSVLVLFFWTGFSLTAQNSPTIMSVDGEPVSKREFESIYKKNNKDSVITDAALDEYVELFINFKLKVKEAEALKLDTNPAFVSELEGYRKQLARPYLVDNAKKEELLREAYDRLHTEVEASHILISVAEDAPPADTLAAYKRIQSLRSEVMKPGADFGKVAKESSDDPSAKTNDGYLGYFTALQMVYPFENAAFNTEKGKVSNIVRTRFGYHILKVTDKRPANGEILVAHVMVKSSADDSDESKAKAQEKIQEIYKEATNGEDFGGLAAKYSDDKASGRNRGELPLFGTGKMVSEFETAAFALKNDGDISEPFQTQYGWHIVKRLELKPLGTYEEVVKDIQSKVARDVRSQVSTRSFVNKVKKDYGFKEKTKALAPVRALVDSTILAGNWRPGSTEAMNAWLFKVGKTKYTQNDFVQFLRATQGRTPETSVDSYVTSRYHLFVDKSAVEYEDARLEGKYEDFRLLMKEYRDGILLFELTDQKVWSKAVEDTAGLRAYYEGHMDDFMYTERLKGPVYRCKDMETANMVRAMVLAGKSNEEIDAQVNKDTQLALTIISSTLEKQEGEISGMIDFKAGVSDIHEVDGNFSFMKVEEILPPSHKPYDKIKGLVTAAYQNKLEKEWISELREKYTVEVDKDVLHSID
jgi:peptidyl-prolyl cis-trans isomerase SurA